MSNWDIDVCWNLHFAGTRYKRRGVDADGHVANYVETEQILLYHHYAISFLQVGIFRTFFPDSADLSYFKSAFQAWI